MEHYRQRPLTRTDRILINAADVNRRRNDENNNPDGSRQTFRVRRSERKRIVSRRLFDCMDINKSASWKSRKDKWHQQVTSAATALQPDLNNRCTAEASIDPTADEADVGAESTEADVCKEPTAEAVLDHSILESVLNPEPAAAVDDKQVSIDHTADEADIGAESAEVGVCEEPTGKEPTAEAVLDHSILESVLNPEPAAAVDDKQVSIDHTADEADIDAESAEVSVCEEPIGKEPAAEAVLDHSILESVLNPEPAAAVDDKQVSIDHTAYEADIDAESAEVGVCEEPTGKEPAAEVVLDHSILESVLNPQPAAVDDEQASIDHIADEANVSGFATDVITRQLEVGETNVLLTSGEFAEASTCHDVCDDLGAKIVDDLADQVDCCNIGLNFPGALYESLSMTGVSSSAPGFDAVDMIIDQEFCSVDIGQTSNTVLAIHSAHEVIFGEEQTLVEWSDIISSGSIDSAAQMCTESSCKDGTPGSSSLTFRSRKRARQPERWKKNMRKRLRQAGLEYVNTNGKVIRGKVLQPASCSCTHKCGAISEEARVSIFEGFQAIGNRNQQAAFILGHVESVPLKTRVTSRLSEKSVPRAQERTKSYRYFLTVPDQGRVQVCRNFFLKTLAVGRKTVHYVLETSAAGVPKPDGRGQKPHNRKPEEARDRIRDHIRSFPAVESHYCRAKTTKTYLDPTLNVRKMYDLYCKVCEDNGWAAEKEKFYRDIFNTEFNISFLTPKKDECNFCTTYKNSSPEQKVVLQPQFEAHHANKSRVRQLKEDHKVLAGQDETVVAITFDLQQVLPCPAVPVGSLYYKRKLSVYNQTVYNLANRSVDCYVWHEGSGGRGSCEMASCLFKFISALPSPVERLIMYSDTCGGQNRNINFSVMCLHAVTVLPVQIIDHIYMESGHSQMECDSVHSTIEKQMKNVPVYSPMDYMAIIRAARRKTPYRVHAMSQEFLNFAHLTARYVSNRTKDCQDQKVSWLKMKWIRYCKSTPNIMLFKYHYDDSFSEMDLTVPVTVRAGSKGKKKRKTAKKRKLMPRTVPVLYTGPVPISNAKFADLQSLCSSLAIPADYHTFYANLTHTSTYHVLDCDQNSDTGE